MFWRYTFYRSANCYYEGFNSILFGRSSTLGANPGVRQRIDPETFGGIIVEIVQFGAFVFNQRSGGFMNKSRLNRVGSFWTRELR